MSPPSRRKAAPQRPSRASDVDLALALFAHEVRTPLTGILALSELLAASPLSERERGWVATIRDSAQHLAALSTLIVESAHNVSGHLVARREPFHLGDFVDRVARAVDGRATAKGLKSEILVAPGLPTHVVGDVVRLRAAIENLVDNAVKFTARGTVALSVTRHRGDIVRFAVSDSGIGLTSAEIATLFKPFVQANADIAQRYGGAGLGLSSARDIARAMGGDLVATKRRGGGMMMTLSVVLPPAPTITRCTPKTVPLLPIALLSVEDHPVTRVVLTALLQELGATVQFVGRGEDAIAILRQGGVDAVLMDMLLPGMSGLETIAAIRRLPGKHRHVPIVGFSGRQSDARAALDAGANAFLIKPASAASLATALLEATRPAAGDA